MDGMNEYGRKVGNSQLNMKNPKCARSALTLQLNASLKMSFKWKRIVRKKENSIFELIARDFFIFSLFEFGSCILALSFQWTAKKVEFHILICMAFLFDAHVNETAKF